MKKLLAILGAVLIVLALSLSVSAAEEYHPHTGAHCVCGGSAIGVADHKCEDITWKPLPEGTTNFSKLASGNYYLTGDVTVTAVAYWSNSQQISLCLNGYDINTTAASVFYYMDAGVVFNICDCSGKQAADGTWTWGGTVTGNRTGGACAYGGIMNVRANALANVYGGNFVGAVGAKNGAVFNVCHDGWDKLDGPASNMDTSLFTKLTVYNGYFQGGEVSGSGGIINVWHNTDVSVYGGTFTGGTATKGGNFCLGSGNYVLHDCVITKGTATDSYGNVSYSNEATLSIERVTITDGTAAKNYGNIYVAADVVDLTTSTISGGSPEVAQVIRSGKYLVSQHNTVQAAFDKAKNSSDLTVRLTRDTQEAATVTGTVYLDLNGFDLSGITVSGTLYGMDSTTDGYQGENAGSLTVVSGVPQVHVKTSTAQTGSIKRYLCVQEKGAYSFHRFYMGITTVVLSPEKSGLGYKACFAGDEAVKAALSDGRAFGMAVSLESIPESLDNNIYRGVSPAYYNTGAPFYKKLVVSNVLSPDATNNNARADMPIYARAYMQLSDGTVLFSTEVSRQMRDMVEAVNADWDNYSQAQKDSMDQLIKAHELYTSGWNVANIHHHDTQRWTPWTGTWVNGGHYYLTENYTLSKMITVPAGQSLSLCLNGHTFEGTRELRRLFNAKGVLNVHDHCDENRDYSGNMITNFSGNVMAPIFYVYETGTFNLCGGNLKPAEGAYAGRGGVGIVGNGSEKIYAVMNMYNGTISGGTLKCGWDASTGTFLDGNAYNANGGNIDLVSYSYFNLYDGKILGGTVTAGYIDEEAQTPITKENANGGNISMGGGSTINMYGGLISGGTATSVGTVGGKGGNIYNSGGILNLYGGEISDGTTSTTATSSRGGNIYNTGTLTIYDCEITGGSASTTGTAGGNGGNIYSSKNLIMYGGLIADGTSSSTTALSAGMGGNIYAGGTVELLGGTICGGKAIGSNGGNICTTANLTLRDVVITGGEAQVMVTDGEKKLGTGLGGGVFYEADKTAVLSGNVQITDNVGSNLYLSRYALVSGEDLAETARIGITAEVHCQVTKDLASKDRFFSDEEGFRTAVINGGVSLIPDALDEALVDQKITQFSVGYNMISIHPKESGLVMSNFGNPLGRYSNDDDSGYELFATSIVVTDANNNTILMVTMDLQNNPEGMMSFICARISEVTGIPEGNIYLSSTHTHNVPNMSSSTAGNWRYRIQVVDALVKSAAAAMADRAPATMQLGSFDTDGLNFSRHYYYPDPDGAYTDADGNPISYFGDQFGTQPSNNSIIKRVQDGDETMHLVAFDRQGKQPVLLSNWRVHPHRSGGRNNCWIDADVIGAAREYMHTNTDYLYAYFNGAAGNMNTSSRINGETFATSSQYKDIHDRITAYGNELGRQIIEYGLPTLKAASTGVIQTSKYIYPAMVDHSEDYMYDAAIAVRDIFNNEPERMDTYEEQTAVAAEYGFSSYFHAVRMLSKYNLGETKDLELNVVSIGDSLAFYTAPGELWDTISVEMEERSPFDTTMVLGYSNGNVAYIPYKVTYSSYEYHYCLFTKDDTINYMMDHWENTLNTFYSNLQ